MIYRKIVMIIISVFILASCISKNSTRKITDEILGTYTFEFPSNEFEVLIIKNDSTFDQKIYDVVDSYHKNKPPMYYNSGNWSVIKDNQLYFSDWLEYCYLRNPDSIRLKPLKIGMANIYWEKSTSFNKWLISIYEETGYVFKKLNEYGK